MTGYGNRAGAGRFPPGISFEGAIRNAMERVAASGVSYPDGYDRMLAEKYRKTGVRYPHILMILGQPRAHHHFFYPCALDRNGRLLDYGCGAMDNVRQLIRDGFPRERITAFDINGESIDLGADICRDWDALRDLVVVSDNFPFRPAEFNTVYSASVIHVIADEVEFRTYLANAFSVLSPGGIFFGSTLGFAEGAAGLPDPRGPPRILTMQQLNGELSAAGFEDHRIVRRSSSIPHYVPRSENLCILEFCTTKPVS